MQLKEAIKLINHPAIFQFGKMVWADFGCESGLFTHALVRRLAPGSKVYAIDRDLKLFQKKEKNPEVIIEMMRSDFIQDKLHIDKLDGILMANSLHFVPNKTAFLKNCGLLFKNKGCFLIVEYDMDEPNPWVPYPISFRVIDGLFKSVGYQHVHKIDEMPSKYHRANIYSALMLQ